VEDRDFNELRTAREDEGKFVCVGLDPQFKSVDDFPADVQGESIDDKLVNFLVPIVETTADIAAWYKPNFSFFLQHGWQGVRALERLYPLMRQAAPGCVMVHDSKNGDIGDTNAGYVRFAFDVLGADAITLHNYMGMQAMLTFLERGDKGCFILARTSNEGANEFQGERIQLQGDPDRLYNYEEQEWPLYRYVAYRVARSWNVSGNCGVVAGASTSSIEDLADVRAKIRDGVPILCPGVGKQGGSAAEAYNLGSDRQGKSIGINSSSGITHAHKKPEYEGVHWAEAARTETQKMHDEITAAPTAA
jgi:orotidine-5'-phosphate decarboxylase